jgi:hypothetical protein
MFAMLLGPWPRVTADGVRLEDLEAAVARGEHPATELAEAIEHVIDQAIGAQLEAGMGLVTDGGVRWADPIGAVLDAIRVRDLGPDGMLLRAWRSAALRTDAQVAASVPGPWTLSIRDVGGWGDAGVVNGRAAELADALAGEIELLGEAGCPVVQVIEPGALAVGASPAARAGYVRAHRRLLAAAGDVHAMLCVLGGSAWGAGAETILDAPYQSFAFDLIGGPDNWYLVRAAPGERGIVCAAFRVGDGAETRDQAPELSWAAHYAASANGRGMDRVGVANCVPLTPHSPDAARAALGALSRAASLAALSPAEAVSAGMDPRTVNTIPGRKRGVRRRPAPPEG